MHRGELERETDWTRGERDLSRSRYEGELVPVGFLHFPILSLLCEGGIGMVRQDRRGFDSSHVQGLATVFSKWARFCSS